MSSNVSSEFLNTLSKLRRGGPGAAPRLHKPLLVLLLLRRYELAMPTRVTYAEIAGPLRRLLVDFGPPVKSPKPHYPFWRLQQDGIWRVVGAGEIPLTKSGDPSPSALTDAHPGEFLPEVDRELRSDPKLVGAAQEIVLRTYISPADQPAVVDAVSRALG